MNETRREFLVVAIGLWQAASLRARQAWPVEPAKSLDPANFLDPPRRAVLRRLMGRIVPADERSAGAMGAKVDEYVDFVLLHAEATLQETWRKGLDRYGMAIDGKDDAGIDSFLAEQARGEFSPHSDDERFFVYLKTAVAEGFYTSEEGIEKELGYQGMTFEMDILGCNHAEHKVPADYKPLLRATEGA